MKKLIPVLIIFLTQSVFSKGVENISEITEFLAGNTFNTCAETEVQMKMKFSKDMNVTIVYKTDWWNDEKNKQEEFVKEDIKTMRDSLSKTKFICAFGYCMVDKDSDFDAVLRDADKAMYADKSAIKQGILAAGGKLHRRAGDR